MEAAKGVASVEMGTPELSWLEVLPDVQHGSFDGTEWWRSRDPSQLLRKVLSRLGLSWVST